MPQEMDTNTHYTGNGRLGPALSFTYDTHGAVALERGVADDKRPRRNVDGTTLKTEVQSGCPTAGHGMQQFHELS